MLEQTPNPEVQLELFRELRRKVHERVEKETAERTEQNPTPTGQEVFAGAFREMLEPHVRDTVFRMREKGYATASSGFGGENGEIQAVDGYFAIDPDTERFLRRYGVSVVRDQGFGKGYTFLEFHSDVPDLIELKRRWNHLAELLPDKKLAAEPNISGASEEFLERYAPTRVDVLVRIRKLREQFDAEDSQSHK